MTWPLALSVDASITRLAPMELRGPLKFLEVQVVDDRYVRLLVGRPDGTFDYYWPREHPLQPLGTELGRGVGYNGPADFTAANFEIGDDGVAIDLDLVDHHGVRLAMKLRQPLAWRGFTFAAPVAADIVKPTALMVPFLFDFDLIVQPGLVFEATYGDEPVGYRSAPLLRRWRPVTFLKACRASVIVELQPDGAVTREDDPGVRTDESGRLCAIVRPFGAHGVRLDIAPPLGSVGAHGSHGWTLTAAGERLASGDLLVSPDGDGDSVELRVTKGWPGARGSALASAFTRLVPVFRRWPLAYSWRGRHTADGLRGSWTNAAARHR